MKNVKSDHRSESGSAGIKALGVFAFLFVAANAGFNYVPVAYEGENFKQEMQTAVVNGMALSGNIKPVETVKARLQQAATDNDLPKEMVLDVRQTGNVITAHASYSKQVNILPFGIYKYDYQFDHTATPTGFLLKDSTR